MNKKSIFILIPLTLIMLSLVSCGNGNKKFKGTYISEEINGKVIQITINSEDNSFVEYINQRKVDEGSFKEKENNVYILEGNIQNFEITLNEDNCFNIFIKKISDEEPIELKNSSEIITGYTTDFGDEEEYIELIK